MKLNNYLVAFALIALTFNYSHVSAQMSQHMIYTPKSINWGDAPPGLPKGAKLAVLSGDPGSTGLFTVRLMFPAGYMIPAHSHPTDEYITVISGLFRMGMGDKYEKIKLKNIPPGGFTVTPQKTNHYAVADRETIVQITAMGPFQINYVNPADDPRSGTNH